MLDRIRVAIDATMSVASSHEYPLLANVENA
jgi:hypothetical protein